MKLALYSAIYGGYDWVKPIPSTLDIPAYLFTDAEDTATAAKKQGWIPIICGMPQPTPMLQHKWWKTHPHHAVPEADATLWIDGSIAIEVDDYVDRCMDALGGDEWVAVRHPWRTCIYEEGYYSSTLERYHDQPILVQLDRYRELGHPDNWGLVATGANVRRHTDAVRALNECWWYENRRWSHQDQLSLPFLFRTMDVRWNTNMPWNEWWKVVPHN